MGSVDLSSLWQHVGHTLLELERPLAQPVVVPHEETDLHFVFCDEHFCLEKSPD